MSSKVLALILGIIIFGSTACAPLSRPVTQREEMAGWGGLAGGATGAIIGSMAGSAVAGGLFGIPLGAIAGFVIGDQMERTARVDRVQFDEREQEIERLRRENERLRQER